MTGIDLELERDVLDGIGRILLSDRDQQEAAATLKLVVAREDEVVPILVKHKVVTIAATNLALLSVASDGEDRTAATRIAALVAPALAIARDHRMLIEAEASQFASLVPRLGPRAGDVAVIKGFCNARFYPAPYERWMRDLDVFVSTWASAVALLDMLLAAGFEYDSHEHPWIKADLPRGRSTYGQIFLIRPMGDDFSRVDIHFGTYSAGFSGYLRPPLTDRLDFVQVGGVDLPVLRPERILLLAHAHALSDGYVAIKDINDFVAIATSAEVDWDEVCTTLREHQLAPQARLLADRVHALYDDARVQAAAESLLEALPVRTQSWRVHDRDWTRRARVNAEFTYRWHRSLGDGIGRSLARAAQCFFFYVRRLSLAVRRRTLRERILRRIMPESDLAHWNLRPESCILLIDLASLDSDTVPDGNASVDARVVHPEGIEWLSVDGHDLLRVESRLYLPTLDLILDPAHVRAGRQLSPGA